MGELESWVTTCGFMTGMPEIESRQKPRNAGFSTFFEYIQCICTNPAVMHMSINFSNCGFPAITVPSRESDNFHNSEKILF